MSQSATVIAPEVPKPSPSTPLPSMPRKIKLNYTPKDTLTERVKIEKEKLFSAPAHIDVRKLKIETEIYKEWAWARSSNMLKAMVFDRLSREKKVWIDGNPI